MEGREERRFLVWEREEVRKVRKFLVWEREEGKGERYKEMQKEKLGKEGTSRFLSWGKND